MNFNRALRIAGYNWPLYAVAGAAMLIGVVIAALPALPASLRWLGGAGAIVSAWYAFASFAAFHWMFDRSELLGGQWLKQLSSDPSRWVQVSVGLEETTLPMEDVFPATEGKSLDFFNPTLMTEPAVTRARQHHTSSVSQSARPDLLPIENDWADLVVVTLAAHEIRNRQAREIFFQELRRIASADAKIIVIEHLRTFVAALAFAGGIFHFYPYGEWIHLSRQAGLLLTQERNITPFIHVFTFQAVPDEIIK